MIIQYLFPYYQRLFQNEANSFLLVFSAKGKFIHPTNLLSSHSYEMKYSSNCSSTICNVRFYKNPSRNPALHGKVYDGDERA
jgi:hypothetical protein